MTQVWLPAAAGRRRCYPRPSMNRFAALLYDPFMAAAEAGALGAWRDELLAKASGVVLEIGAGTGVNLSRYGEAVERLVLCEPAPGMRSQLARRISDRPVELLDVGVEALPLPDESVDVVVSTLVLCSVEDPARALGELRRVLKPGGRLIFIEHVAAEDNPGRLVWQRRLEPAWRSMAGNCHLTRRTADDILAAGFEITELIRGSMPRALPWVRPTIRGVAVRA